MGRPSDFRKLGILLTVMTALRGLAAVQVPLLAGEAYYWLWGQYPAAGYFDHPPMTGLVNALFFSWIHGSQLAARSAPIVLSALTSLATYALARELFPGDKTAWRATLLLTIAPLFDLGGVMNMPDNSLILFMTLAWLFFWRAAERRTNLGLWALAGAASGLALLSKFHAWILLPPLWGFLLISRRHRGLLASPGPWLGAGVALLVLSPNLVWNAERGWMNYVFQWHRSSIPESRFKPAYVAQYFLMPLVTMSPLLYAAMLGGAWKGFRVWLARDESRLLYLLCAGLPLPAFLGALSFAVEISAHWPSSGYLPLVILGVALIERGDLFGPRFNRAMPGTTLLMTALLHAFPLYVGALPKNLASPLAPDLANTGRLQRAYGGWRELGEKVRTIRDEMNAEAPTVIMAKNWHLTSMLAFYSERPHEAFAYLKEDAHNFEVWRKERGGLAGANAVVVIRKGDPDKKHLSIDTKYDKFHRTLDPLFERVVPVPSLVYYEDGAIEEYWGVDVSRPRIKEFLIFRCYGFKGKLAEGDEASH